MLSCTCKLGFGSSTSFRALVTMSITKVSLLDRAHRAGRSVVEYVAWVDS